MKFPEWKFRSRLEFTLFVEPKGMPRARSRHAPLRTKTGKTIFITKPYIPAAATEYKEDMLVQMLSQHKPLNPLPEGPIRLSWIAMKSRPKHAPKKREVFNIVKPDRDNIDKAILDCMKGKYFTDDAVIVTGEMHKLVGDVGAPPVVYILLEYDLESMVWEVPCDL